MKSFLIQHNQQNTIHKGFKNSKNWGYYITHSNNTKVKLDQLHQSRYEPSASLMEGIKQVRREIPTPLLMPANKTKREIEARMAQSRSSQQVQGADKKLNKEVDLDMERLIRAAEGPSLSREFDELLKVLKASLNNNHFIYKKALDKTINFIRVIMVNQDNFL
ncbi:hypothetical protein AgCh_031928 [Apium graveolens]